MDVPPLMKTRAHMGAQRVKIRPSDYKGSAGSGEIYTRRGAFAQMGKTPIKLFEKYELLLYTIDYYRFL